MNNGHLIIQFDPFLTFRNNLNFPEIHNYVVELEQQLKVVCRSERKELTRLQMRACGLARNNVTRVTILQLGVRERSGRIFYSFMTFHGCV